MKPYRAGRPLIAALILALAATGATADPPGALLGVQSDLTAGTTPVTSTAVVTPPAPGLGPQLRADATAPVMAKLADGKELLTEKEFVTYLRAVEAKNPGKSWAQIVTKLHEYYYAADSTLVFVGIPLFKNTKENEGWEVVNLIGQPPKFIKADDGAKVDISHSYAGVRALIGRNVLTAPLMGNVNTGWGDSIQVAGGRISAVERYIAGAFTFDYDKSYKAMDQFSDAANFKPDDQIRGNTIGMKVMEIVRKNRKSERLSDAYAQVLNE